MKELAAAARADSMPRFATRRPGMFGVFENEARLAGDQVASLSATLAQQSETVAAGNADDVRLRALDMEAKAARDQLEFYLQKYREAEARDADNASPASARVIATAEPPRAPAFPKVWQTIVLATLAGFVVSTGVAAAAALASGETESDGARLVPAGGPTPPPPAAWVEEPAPPPLALVWPEPNRSAERAAQRAPNDIRLSTDCQGSNDARLSTDRRTTNDGCRSGRGRRRLRNRPKRSPTA